LLTLKKQRSAYAYTHKGYDQQDHYAYRNQDDEKCLARGRVVNLSDTEYQQNETSNGSDYSPYNRYPAHELIDPRVSKTPKRRLKTSVTGPHEEQHEQV
jgi:hypothetical protein